MYKITDYIDRIANNDADTQKRFAMIEKLSQGFTKENKTALELDKLLVEQLELEREPDSTEANIPIPNRKHLEKRKNVVNRVIPMRYSMNFLMH